VTSPSVLPRLGRAYAAAVISLGLIAIGQSLFELSRTPIGSEWLLLAVLTLISGSASVKLPGSHVSISISEAFVFTAVLLYGPAAGTLTVTLDALVISFWIAKRRPEPVRALINISAPALSAWLSARLFFWTAGIVPLVDRAASLSEILPSLALFALTYFGLNSWLIALVIGFERRENPFQVWRRGFLLLSLNYFYGASVAILLIGNNRAIDLRFLGATVPLLLVLYFTYKTSMDRVHDANRHVEELNTLYISTVETLAMAIDAKDQVTHGHIRRVQTYAVGLARKVGVIDATLLKAIEAAALLHDMGKLAVPEYILNKPGKLTAAEFEKMKLHASVGADILSAIDFPYPVVPIVRHHHENWDGSGYPHGVKGTAIPIGARILSVVDCFDALTSDRPYRPKLGNEEAIRILLQRRGSMYDPLIVDTFVLVHQQLGDEAQARELTLAAPSRAAVHNASNDQPAPSDTTEVQGLDEIPAGSDEMVTLYEFAGALAGQTSIGDKGDAISKHVRRLIPSSLCVIYLYNATTDELEATHVVGQGHSLVRGLKIPLGKRLSGWVATNRQTIANSDPVLDLGEIARTAEPRLRSCLSTPLVADEQLVGVLTLYSTATVGFQEKHKRIIEAIGQQVAYSYSGSVQFERESQQDPLTGLPTQIQLERLLDLSRSKRKPDVPEFTILLIDIVNLKHINIRYGRQIGDDVIRDVARSAISALQPRDILFRYADDEFVALLNNTDIPAADALATEIRCRVSKASGASTNRPAFEVRVVRIRNPQIGESLQDLIASRDSSSAEFIKGERRSVH
jgi:diguanylate cyclase (GGDEF)-like protein/putative nucleotidyltransferase with HDIG domain